MENKSQYAVSWAEAFRDVANNVIDKLPILLCFIVLIISMLSTS